MSARGSALHSVCPQLSFQVVEFDSEDLRMNTIAMFREALVQQRKSILLDDDDYERVYKRAITQEKRQNLLEKFFRSVFSEV